MNNVQQQGPKIRFLPPMYFLIGMTPGIALQWRHPIPLHANDNIVTSLGVTLIAISFALIFWSLLHLMRVCTAINIRKPATHLVQSGPYRLSRNPMYLSLIILLTGIACVCNSLWLVISLFFAAAIVNHHVIRPEESYLENKFGTQYVRYKNRVRRWL